MYIYICVCIHTYDNKFRKIKQSYLIIILKLGTVKSQFESQKMKYLNISIKEEM